MNRDRDADRLQAAMKTWAQLRWQVVALSLLIALQMIALVTSIYRLVANE